jgi:hypothetical protein
MSTEEFGELFGRDMSLEPTIPDAMMEDAEVHEPTQDWPGWSTDDITLFNDTSAIHNEESFIEQEAMEVVTAEVEVRKEEAAIGNTRRTPLVSKKAVQATKPTATVKTSTVQSSLEAAVAKGTAAKDTTEKKVKLAATAQSEIAGTIDPKSTAKEPTQSMDTTTTMTETKRSAMAPKTTTTSTAMVSSPLAAVEAGKRSTGIVPPTMATTATSAVEISSLAAAAAAGTRSKRTAPTTSAESNQPSQRGANSRATSAPAATRNTSVINTATKTPGNTVTQEGTGRAGQGKTSNPSVEAAASAGQVFISMTPAQMIASSTSYLPPGDKFQARMRDPDVWKLFGTRKYDWNNFQSRLGDVAHRMCDVGDLIRWLGDRMMHLPLHRFRRLQIFKRLLELLTQHLQ